MKKNGDSREQSGVIHYEPFFMVNGQITQRVMKNHLKGGNQANKIKIIVFKLFISCHGLQQILQPSLSSTHQRVP